MIFGFYQISGLIYFCLIFSFTKAYLVGNFIITIYNVNNNLVFAFSKPHYKHSTLYIF